MATHWSYLSGFNAFVPAATEQIIAYVKSPDKYRLNRYVQYIPTESPVGVYFLLNPDDTGRFQSRHRVVWSDGGKRPEGTRQDQIRHDMVEFQTIRYSEGFEIGWKAIKHASYKVLVAHTTLARNRIMMGRTTDVINLGLTAANWGTHTETANNLNGGAGFWGVGNGSDPDSANFLAIKKTMDEVARRINLDTNGAVGDLDLDEDGNQEDLMLIISPGAAIKMSQSPELHAYLKESPYALDQVMGRKKGQNTKWGLPDHVYGWRLVVENATVVTENPNVNQTLATSTGLTPTRKFIMSDNSAIVASRPGGLTGEYGAPSFSTFQIYHLGGLMQLETRDDPWNRLTEGAASEDLVPKLAAPASGFLITNLFS